MRAFPLASLLLACTSLSACTMSPTARPMAAAPTAIEPTAPSPAATRIATPAYPQTPTGHVVENHFGEQLADPYRWLEEDVRTHPEVAQWVAQQNGITHAYLEQLPGRDRLAALMREIYNFRRIYTPVKRGGHYFYRENSGLQNQSVLMVRDSLNGEGRLLIDPNSWSKDAATALDDWRPSDDGSRIVYSIQDGGSDWRTIRVLDAASGRTLPDELKWAKFTNLAWVGDDGFLYSRFPEPQGAEFQALNTNQAIYYHKLGTPQSADRLVYSTPATPKRNHVASVTNDGRWMVITTSEGTDNRYEIHVAPIGHGDWKPRPLISGLTNDWSLIDGIGDRLWFVTDKNAPLKRIVMVDLSGPKPVFTDVVPEGKATLTDAAIVGDKLVLTRLADAQSRIELAGLDGHAAGVIPLKGIGTVAGVVGRPGDPEAFYSFESFARPATVYRYDVASGRNDAFATPKLAFNPDDYVTQASFYTSKDGTKIPIFVTRRRDVTLPAPTLLYGYGGFDISVTPGFSLAHMAWMAAGGVYAQASLRGGGEYGKAWHDAGRLANKQNVFDDFIAAGEWLKKRNIAAPHGLAVEGRSNGGLLIGAVVNQRPDLFDAAHAAVGVMDMLRFDRFTAGRYWVDDYGHPDVAADYQVLRAYSPYHNIHAADYPAVIVSTADTDDRVVPGHSFKYISRLQATQAGTKPHLIRIETRAGHGSGKPTDKLIEEYSDIYAFLGYWTGLNLGS